MDNRNKTILAMFSLAFCALAGLQVAGKYVSFSQSSVLGESASIETALGGKPNFALCNFDQQCNSGTCDMNTKRCIPKPASSPFVAQYGQKEPEVTPVSTTSTTQAQYIPCGELKALEAQYCTNPKQTTAQRLAGSLSCLTFQRNISSFCK